MASELTAIVISGLLVLIIIGHVFWVEIQQGVLLRCLDALDWLLERLAWFRRKHAEVEAELKRREEQVK